MPQLNSVFKDYYQILQVSPEAENEIITAAYYALMKKYHPDISGDRNSDKAKLINEAYEILSDTGKRLQYYQEYLENQHSTHKKHTDHSSYISKRFDLKVKEEELKKKEEELSERELKLKMKSRIFEEFQKNTDKNSDKIEALQYARQFVDSVTTKQIKDISDKIRKISQPEEKLSVIKQILGNKLSLEQESFAYDLLLDIRIPEAYPFLEGAFKFKQFYPRILNYYLQENLNLFKNKMSLIFGTISFSNGSNSDILMLLMEIYPKIFTRDELLQFLFKFQELVEENNLQIKIKTQILLKFLLLIKENDFMEFFKPLIKKLKKDKDPLIQTMAGSFS